MMALSLYSTVTGMLSGALDAVERILEKGEAHCRETGMSTEELLGARLHETMLPAARQVMIVTDNAKSAMNRLTGNAPPSWPDTETSVAELRLRIGKAREQIAARSEADFAGSWEKSFQAPFGRKVVDFTGETYLMTYLIPNLQFHVSILYAIYRMKGVPLGKADLLGW
jgi:uncharacterized protein